jgi:DHA1 family tetracycline resistance protein-like MFS transporter
MTVSSPALRTRQAAVSFILVTVVLDMLSFGIIIPVLPKLVEDFVAGDTAQASVVYGLMGPRGPWCSFSAPPFKAPSRTDSDGGRSSYYRTPDWDSIIS